MTARRWWPRLVAVTVLLVPLVTGPTPAAAAEATSPAPRADIDISLVGPVEFPSPGNSGEITVRIVNKGNVTLEIVDIFIGTPDELVDFVPHVERCDLLSVNPGESVDVPCVVATDLETTCAPIIGIVVSVRWGPSENEEAGFRIEEPNADIGDLPPCPTTPSPTGPPTDTASPAAMRRRGADPALAILTAAVVVGLSIAAAILRRATPR